MKWWKKNKGLLLFLFLQFPVWSDGQIVNIERQRLNADSNGIFGDATMSFRIVKQVQALYSFSQNAEVVYRKDEHQLFLVENLLFIKSPGNSFANSGFIHLRYQRPAEKRLMFESFFQVQFNKLIKVQYRQLLAAGGRFELFPKNHKQRAFVGAALMNEYEIVQNREQVNFNMRMSYYLAFRMKLWKKVEYNGTTYYQPKVAYARDYRLSTQNSLLFDFTENIQFNFQFSLYYDQFPPPGVVNSTYSILNGIRYKF
ncbi:MAG: DUF481 domain-containing protein [Bacteroidetes bacterium]|nr:DUF481 domain-containing protein [Bacteroidota bacterium]